MQQRRRTQALEPGYGRRCFGALLLAAGLAAAAPTGARTVQKCVDAAGHVTLTSGECGAGDQLVARYDAVPEPVSVAPAATAAAGAATVPGPPRGGTSGKRGARRSVPRARARPDACQAARVRREKTLQRVGLKRTFDLLRKLDDEVWAACR